MSFKSSLQPVKEKSRNNSFSEQNNIDFNAHLNTINWSCKFDINDSKDYNKIELLKLANELRGELVEDDLSDFIFTVHIEAFNYIMGNTTQVTIAEFIAVLEPAQETFKSLMTCLHADVVANQRNKKDHDLETKMQAMQEQIDKQTQQLHAQAAREQSSGSHGFQTNNNQLNLPLSYQIQNNSNSTQQNFQQNTQNDCNQQNQQSQSTGSSYLPPSFLIQDTSVPKPNNSSDTVSRTEYNELQQLVNRLAGRDNARQAQIRRPKIGKDPPVYDSSKHHSLRHFAQREFSRWALGQSLSEAESTLFLYASFTLKIERDQIDAMARNKDNSPVYTSVLTLMENIIVELRYDEEDLNHLIEMYHAFDINSKKSLVHEFLRVLELRVQAFVGEIDRTSIKEAKIQFLRRLNPNLQTHQTLYLLSEMSKWKDAHTSRQVTTLLRTLEGKFKMKPTSHYANPQKPTNNSQSTPMEGISNIQNLPATQQQQQYMGQNLGLATPSNQINNSSEKRVCVNTKCGKTFVPFRPKFRACSSPCMKAAQEQGFFAKSKPTYNAKEKAYKKVNATSEQCNGTSNPVEEVSYGNFISHQYTCLTLKLILQLLLKIHFLILAPALRYVNLIF